VITNFLSNAIRYAGKLKPKVAVRLEKNSKELVFSVADNGIGIPKEVQPRIFQKFFRADNAVKQVADGSGLGLYVVKMIMESGGGRVWFASDERKGTIFYAAIPLSGMKEKAGEKGLAA
jgi:signal transduction histidine kinase